MLHFRVIAVLVLAASVAGCFKSHQGWGYTGNDPARYSGQRIHSAWVAEPPCVDGSKDDAAWRASVPIEILAQGPIADPGAPYPRFMLQSVHTDTHVYIAVSWRETPIDGWLGAPPGQIRPSPEDRAPAAAGTSLAVALHGGSDLARFEGTWDVWHWTGLFRGADMGRDETWRFSTLQPDGRSIQYAHRDGKVWITRLHETEPPSCGIEVTPPPAEGVVDSPFPPTTWGMARADVHAHASLCNGHWIVEFERRLDTRDPLDVVVGPDRDVPIALVTFDASGGVCRVSHGMRLCLQPHGHDLPLRAGRASE